MVFRISDLSFQGLLSSIIVHELEPKKIGTWVRRVGKT